MRELAALTEQIRAVRDAQKRFMRLWRVEQILVGPEGLDRLAADMADAHRELDALDELDGFAGSSEESSYFGPRIWSMYGNEGADGAS